MNIKKAVNMFMQITRFAVYDQYLVFYLPSLIILFNNGLVDLASTLLLLAPFLTTMIAGFTYNTIMDADMDPPEQNPITRHAISLSATYKLILLPSTFASVALFLLMYGKIVPFTLAFLYLLAWFMYSGLKVRFKATYLQPIVASFVLWTAGPMLLLLEFEQLNMSTVFLVAGIFCVGFSREVSHAIHDYPIDHAQSCKTLVVRLGLKTSNLIKFSFFLAGFALILLWSQSLTFNLYITMGGIALVSACLLADAKFGLGLDPDPESLVSFFGLEAFIVICILALIGLPLFISAVVLFLYLLNPRRYGHFKGIVT